MSFEIKKISLIDLEKIFSLNISKIKKDILNSRFILCNLIKETLDNKITRDKIINLLKICYFSNKEEYLEITNKQLEKEDDLKIFINSTNLENGILNAWHINYMDFDELLYNGLLNSCFGYYSSFEENKESEKSKTLKIKKIKLNSNQVNDFIDNSLTEEDLMENSIENYELTITKTNYNEAIELRKELDLRNQNFTFLNKDFIEKFSKFIKIDGRDLTYEKFIEIVDSDFTLAVELVFNFVNYNFAFDFKKKNQFLVK
jgi:hypothetical protein